MASSLTLGEGNGTPLQYSCLENPMGEGAWWAAVHGVTKSRTRLSDFTFTFHFHALEKETTTHSSVLAWRIPETGEPGGLPSMGSHRVRHDWSDLAAAAAAWHLGIILWVFLENLFVCFVSQSCPTLPDPLNYIACQAPTSMGFSRQEYWSELPFPSPGDLPDLGIEPRSPALQAGS